MTGYVPNPRIVDRAVALWIEMLSDPKYDNLGSSLSPDSIATNSFASALVEMIPKNNTPDVLTRFGDELRNVLMAPFKWTYKDRDGSERENEHPAADHLSVDYGPDMVLSTAADRAGLKMQFPWKTSMHLTGTYLCLGYGYGAPYVYHYPLADDRWLVTTLHGDDIDKIMYLVEQGIVGIDLHPRNP